MPGPAHVELGHFLRSRRLRLAPGEVGLTAVGRRRTPGLRREEVALLANVSPTWYTCLEQGRNVRASAEVLGSLAAALNLNATERRYLLALGGPEHTRLDLQPPDRAMVALRSLMELCDDLVHPVYATDGRGALLGWNRCAVEWYDDFAAYQGDHRNIVWWMFRTAVARSRIVNWEHDARNLAARVRYFVGTSNTEPSLQRFVDDIRSSCGEFAAWWDDHDVAEQDLRHRTFDLGARGVHRLRLIALRLAECPSVTVVMHGPDDGSPTP